jgi:hypothetical protein
MYGAQCEASDRLVRRAEEAEELLNAAPSMVPAAWLAKANLRISELSDQLVKMLDTKASDA